ncbi:hypothetical protein WJX72_005977 [[Myrmecia] bisecta]|uniref:Uncharacterized protein n=1 Tax=[Myrmecia] bisecta TaxID=41462 RepID=A0AAW1PNV3_9CHLO
MSSSESDVELMDSGAEDDPEVSKRMVTDVILNHATAKRQRAANLAAAALKAAQTRARHRYGHKRRPPKAAKQATRCSSKATQ